MPGEWRLSDSYMGDQMFVTVHVMPKGGHQAQHYLIAVLLDLHDASPVLNGRLLPLPECNSPLVLPINLAPFVTASPDPDSLLSPSSKRSSTSEEPRKNGVTALHNGISNGVSSESATAKPANSWAQLAKKAHQKMTPTTDALPLSADPVLPPRKSSGHLTSNGTTNGHGKATGAKISDYTPSLPSSSSPAKNIVTSAPRSTSPTPNSSLPVDIVMGSSVNGSSVNEQQRLDSGVSLDAGDSSSAACPTDHETIRSGCENPDNWVLETDVVDVRATGMKMDTVDVLSASASEPSTTDPTFGETAHESHSVPSTTVPSTPPVNVWKARMTQLQPPTTASTSVNGVASSSAASEITSAAGKGNSGAQNLDVPSILSADGFPGLGSHARAQSTPLSPPLSTPLSTPSASNRSAYAPSLNDIALPSSPSYSLSASSPAAIPYSSTNGRRKQWKPLEVEIRYNAPLPPKNRSTAASSRDQVGSSSSSTSGGPSSVDGKKDSSPVAVATSEKRGGHSAAGNGKRDEYGNMPPSSGYGGFSKRRDDESGSDGGRRSGSFAVGSGRGAALETPGKRGTFTVGQAQRKGSPESVSSERRGGYRGYSHSPGYYRGDRIGVSGSSGSFVGLPNPFNSATSIAQDTMGSDDGTRPIAAAAKNTSEISLASTDYSTKISDAATAGSFLSPTSSVANAPTTTSQDDDPNSGRMRRSYSAPLNSLESVGPYSHGSVPPSPSYRRSTRYPNQHGSWSAARQSYGTGTGGYYQQPPYYGSATGYAVGGDPTAAAAAAAAAGMAYASHPNGAYLSLYTGPGGMAHGLPGSPTAAGVGAFAIPDPTLFIPSQLTISLVKSYIRAQVEWYFSTDNLCRDLFLRRHMDSNGGWVEGKVLAAFRRVSGWIEHLRVMLSAEAEADRETWAAKQIALALGDSMVVEVESGEGTRMRKKESWEMWLLPATMLSAQQASAKGVTVDVVVVTADVAVASQQKVDQQDSADEMRHSSSLEVSENPLVSDETSALPGVPPFLNILSAESKDDSPAGVSTVVEDPKENSLVTCITETPLLPMGSDVTVVPVTDTVGIADDEEHSSNKTAESFDEEGTHDDAGEPTLIGDNGSTSSVDASEERAGQRKDLETGREIEVQPPKASILSITNDTADTMTDAKDRVSAESTSKISWSELEDDGTLPPIIPLSSMEAGRPAALPIQSPVTVAPEPSQTLDEISGKLTTAVSKASNLKPGDSIPAPEAEAWITVTSSRKVKKAPTGPSTPDFGRWSESRPRRTGSTGGEEGVKRSGFVATEKSNWKKSGFKTGTTGVNGGRTALTYEEALKSERLARSKEDDSMHEEWKKRILTLAHYGTSRADHVVEYAYNVLKDIPYLNERIHTDFNVAGHSVPLTFECEVCEIVPREDPSSPQLVKLKVLASNTEPGAAKVRDQLQLVHWDRCRRDRVAFSKNNFKRFLRESTVRELWTGAPLLVRPELMRRYKIEKEMPEDVVELYRRRLDSSNILLSKKMQRDQANQQRRAQKSFQRRDHLLRDEHLMDALEDVKPILFPAEDLDVFRWPDLHTRADRPELEGDWGIAVRNAVRQHGQDPTSTAGVDAGSLVFVWNFLAVFGVPLKLYPFTLDDFIAALCNPHPGNELLAEVFNALVNLARMELNKFLVDAAKKKITASSGVGAVNVEVKGEGADDDLHGESKPDTDSSVDVKIDVTTLKEPAPISMPASTNGVTHLDQPKTSSPSAKEIVTPVLEQHLSDLQYWNVFPWTSIRTARAMPNCAHRLSSWTTAVVGCVLDMLSVVVKDGQEESKCADFWTIAGKLVGVEGVGEEPGLSSPSRKPNGSANGTEGPMDGAIDFYVPRVHMPVADRVRLARQEDHEAQLNERAMTQAAKEAAKEAAAHATVLQATPPVTLPSISGRLRKRNVAAVYASLNADSDGDVERGDDEYVDELAWAFEDPSQGDKGNRRSSKRQKFDKGDPSSQAEVNVKDELSLKLEMQPGNFAQTPGEESITPGVVSAQISTTALPPISEGTSPPNPVVTPPPNPAAALPPREAKRELTFVERVNLGWRKLLPAERFELVRFLVEEVAMESKAVKDYVTLAEDQITELRKEKIEINKEKKDLAQGWLDYKTREYEEQNGSQESGAGKPQSKGRKGTRSRGGRGVTSEPKNKSPKKNSSFEASFDGSDSSLSPYDEISSSDSDSALYSGDELDEPSRKAGVSGTSNGGDRASLSSVGKAGSDYDMGSGSEADVFRQTSRQLNVIANQQKKADDSRVRRAAEKTAKAELRDQAKQIKEVKRRVDEKKGLEDRERHNNRREKMVERQMLGWFQVLRARPLGRDRFFNRYWWFDSGFGGGAAYFLHENPLSRPGKRSQGSANGDLDEKPGTGSWGLGRLVVEVVGSEGEEKSHRNSNPFILPKQPKDNIPQPRGKDDPHCLPAQAWGYYSRPEQINQLLEWLNEKGFRESKLRASINKMRKEISQVMEQRMEDIVTGMMAPEEGEFHRVTRADSEAERGRGYVNKWAFDVPK
ncbi:hypothetical protein HDU93_007225 [Gonapodya sp. JEL0774]|nr:hypothetical protein HDU93_007225 [Gonapodya sp. JEL0774]